MTEIKLTGGYYTSRSLPAAAQRCQNLYPEPTPASEGEPISYWDYETPGLILLGTAPVEQCRCAYTATNGDLYMVFAQNLYYVDPSWVFHLVGSFVGSALSDVVARWTPVSISDNGINLLIVDGSVDGWTVDMASRAQFTRIVASGTQAGFQGSPLVCYQDSFFICSRSGTNQFYVSGSSAISFNALDFASKNAKADNIVGVLSCHRVLWIVGQTSYECWYNSGGSGTIIDDFPFSLIPSAYGNWGCAAVGTLKTANNEIYWLSQDNTGRGVVMKGQSDYSTVRVSTHAIEEAIRTYPRIDDATAYLYNQNAHQFYMLHFPSANEYRGVTWCYDTATQLWHERVFTDLNGLSWRHSISFATNAYGTIVGGDWATKNFYELDLDTYNDYGNPIVRLRTFPHSIDTEGQRRVTYRQLTLFMETGSSASQGDILVPLVEFSATAGDGTLLQNYVNASDLGASFTKISGVNAVITGDVVVGSANGTALYEINTLPTKPDYEIDYQVSLTNFSVPDSTSEFFVIGRANPSNNGYKSSITSDGINLSLHLIVMGGATTTIGMGNLSAGHYRLTLVLEGDVISLSAFRSTDNMWLTPAGLWQAVQTPAASIVDTTYVLAGTILLGGTWV